MNFDVFLTTYGWAIIAVFMAVVVFAVTYLIFRKCLSKKLASLEDTKEAYTKMWIFLAISAVLTIIGYYGISWVLKAEISWVWYAFGALIGCVLSIVVEFKKAGLSLHNLKHASAQVATDMEGVRAVAKKAGIVDDEKFNSIMGKVNDEIKTQLETVEKVKDEKTVSAFKEALISYLIQDGNLDDTDKEILKKVGVTEKDLDKSKVMFDFLNS